MQDEPGAGSCFSYKMSLKEGFRMLGIDHQHGRRRTTEPGTDPGVCGSQRRDAFSFPGPAGIVRVGEMKRLLRSFSSHILMPAAAVGVPGCVNHRVARFLWVPRDEPE